MKAPVRPEAGQATWNFGSWKPPADDGETTPLVAGLGVSSQRSEARHGSGGFSKHHFNSEAELQFRTRELKAEVADTYAICSALLTGFYVCTIFINHGDIEHEQKTDKLRYYTLITHQVIVRMCTALALFSTLVFMLTSMYLKTALAGKHFTFEIYDYFSHKTSGARKLAFWSMYYSCIMYMISICLSLFYSLPDGLALCLSFCILCFLVILIWYSQHMVDTAMVIFLPEDTLRKMFKKDELREDSFNNTTEDDDDDDSCRGQARVIAAPSSSQGSGSQTLKKASFKDIVAEVSESEQSGEPEEGGLEV